MIHHVVFLKLKAGTPPETLEEMVRQTRSLLLRIPEVLNVRSGRNVDPEAAKWPFYYSYEVASLAKLAIVKDDPFYLKLHETCIKPHITSELEMSFELDPSKNLKYS